MKVRSVFGLLSGVTVVLALAYTAHSSTNLPNAPGAIPSPQRSIISCSSDNMRRNYCAADVRAGVQLVKQRSDADCVFNRTWGYDRRGIWVDRGCRADFQVGGSGWGGWDNGYNIYCASDDGRRNICPTDTRGGVELIRKRSDASCDFGRSWGYTPRGVWVDRGCRADFQIGRGGGPGGGGPGGGGGGWQPGGGSVQLVNCSSNDMGRKNCPVNTNGGVRLVRQRSDADCIFNRTWGYDRRGIWVDRGCRADFEVGRLR